VRGLPPQPIAALALTAVIQPVGGVALKQAVDAWAHAPTAEQASRFAGAEVVRWLEWGTRSYQRSTIGAHLPARRDPHCLDGRISWPRTATWASASKLWPAARARLRGGRGRGGADRLDESTSANSAAAAWAA
jgi:hypothetical protein